MIKFSAEIARKSIHFSSLWIPISYLYIDQLTLLSILMPLSILTLFIDLSRSYFPALSKLTDMVLGKIMREEEKAKFVLSGATYLLISSSISVYIFTQEVAIFALSTLMISDSFAALIGRKFGRIQILDKSLEGSLSFAFSALAIYCFLQIFYNFTLPLSTSLIAILLGTIMELFAKKLRLDDNLVIPLVIGSVFYL